MRGIIQFQVILYHCVPWLWSSFPCTVDRNPIADEVTTLEFDGRLASLLFKEKLFKSKESGYVSAEHIGQIIFLRLPPNGGPKPKGVDDYFVAGV